jgi:hypothetical protein
MKAMGVDRRPRCCPGHDTDSKKFDRANRHRRWNTASRKSELRTLKRVERTKAKEVIDAAREDR